MNDTITPGSMRKRIYDFLRAEGFDVNDARHKVLSNLIKLACSAQFGEYQNRIGDLTSKLNNREIALGARRKDPVLFRLQGMISSESIIAELERIRPIALEDGWNAVGVILHMNDWAKNQPLLKQKKP